MSVQGREYSSGSNAFPRGIPAIQNPPGKGFLKCGGLLSDDYGPGYRVYYKEIYFQKEIVILLCGGDKGTQTKDIARAKGIFKSYKPEDEEED
jgi:hypothetical protein